MKEKTVVVVARKFVVESSLISYVLLFADNVERDFEITSYRHTKSMAPRQLQSRLNEQKYACFRTINYPKSAQPKPSPTESQKTPYNLTVYPSTSQQPTLFKIIHSIHPLFTHLTNLVP